MLSFCFLIQLFSSVDTPKLSGGMGCTGGEGGAAARGKITCLTIYS